MDLASDDLHSILLYALGDLLRSCGLAPAGGNAAAPSLVAEDATDSAPASAVGAAIAGPVFDPTALPIADRVRLLRHRIAARQRGDIGAGGSSANGTRTVGSAGSRLALSAAELGGHVLSACTAAGVGAEAAPVVLQQVVRSKVASHPDTLLPFLRSLHSLSQRYGETVVLEWLRRAPPIIRAEAEVPARLARLATLLGNVAESRVLSLTQRCPVLLGVDAQLLQPRLQHICELLGRDMDREGASILEAAPALLAMQPSTLTAKVQHLRAIAVQHPRWQADIDACPTKSLAVLLTYSTRRQLRLAYVAEVQQAAAAAAATAAPRARRRRGSSSSNSCSAESAAQSDAAAAAASITAEPRSRNSGSSSSLMTVMSISTARMRQLYPGYDAWLQQQQQQQAQADGQKQRKQLPQKRQQVEEDEEEEGHIQEREEEMQ